MKNMVKDLSEEQLDLILQEDVDAHISVYDGKSLREFIQEEFLEEATLSELYKEMEVYRLKWPFRLLKVTVEASITRGYNLAVLDDETIEAYAKGEIELDQIDPRFKLEEAEEETASGYMDGYINYDYAVCDDRDRTLVDWD